MKGLSLNQAQLLLTTQGLNAEKSKEVLRNAGLIASENAIQAELLESTLIKAGLNKEEREAILNKLGLIQGEGAEAVVQGTCTKADLEAVLAQKLKNAEDAEGIIKALGLAGANTTTTASFGLLTKSIWANIKAMEVWKASNPIGWVVAIGAAIIGVSLAVVNYNKKLEESRQETIEAGKEAAQLTKDLDGLIEQYRKLGEDGKLDNSDREQAYDIQQQINELLGDEVDYINLANGKYEDQLELLKKLQREKARDKRPEIVDAKISAEDSLKDTIGTNIVLHTQSTDNGYGLVKNVLEGLDLEDYIQEKTETSQGTKTVTARYFNIEKPKSAEEALKIYGDMVKIKEELLETYDDELSQGGELYMTGDGSMA